jgi:hypothetical protein
VERPIAVTLLAVGAALVLLNLWSFARRGLDWRTRMALEEGVERR